MILYKNIFLCMIIIIIIINTAICAPTKKEASRKRLNKNEMKALKAMNNNQLLEGDILIRTKDNKKNRKFKKYNSNIFRNAVSSDEFIWKNGIIPYYIDDSVSNYKDLILKGMRQIEKYTCVRFREKTDQDVDFVKIFKGNGCYGSIGYDPDFPEGLLSLGEGCYYIGTVVHELMHVVGYYHEHNRQDRDKYLKIYYDNIKPNAVDQFQINDPINERIFTAFDYNSVMLYGPRAFSFDDNAITMEPKLNGFYMIEVFEKPGMTKLDAESIKQLYKCPK